MLLLLYLFSTPSLLFFLLFPVAHSAVIRVRQSKAPAFFLAGDSTTAPQASGSGGWGDGFLAALTNGANGKNFGKNGSTTVSFQKGGFWEKVMAAVSGAKGRKTYVTIQFGHNDQKKDKGISDADFAANLKKLANQVKAQGATPILVTPLTRRQFSGSTLSDSLARQREIVLTTAKQGGYKVIDLNSESRRYVKAIGQSSAMKYNPKESDLTHLNKHGTQVFGRMVADLIVGILPELKTYFKADAAVTAAIKAGKYV